MPKGVSAMGDLVVLRIKAVKKIFCHECGLNVCENE